LTIGSNATTPERSHQLLLIQALRSASSSRHGWALQTVGTYGGGAGTASDSGQFTAASNATLELAGTRTEQSGATVGGAGIVDITGNTTFNAASNLTNSGTFEIDGLLQIASGVTVSTANLTLNGNLQGPGSMVVSRPASMSNSAYLGVYKHSPYGRAPHGPGRDVDHRQSVPGGCLRAREPGDDHVRRRRRVV
jgi:hypothetical protein